MQIAIAEPAEDCFSHSGLILTLVRFDGQAEAKDLNVDKGDAWERNYLVRMIKENGEEIDDRKIYTLATNDFLAKGGDDLEWAMKQIPLDRVVLDSGGFVRDVVQKFIETHTPINSTETPMVDREAPSNSSFCG